MERFKVEGDSSGGYVLHVNDNGLSGRYSLRAGHLRIRGGSIVNINEMPPTRSEFDQMIAGLDACTPTSSGREEEVFLAFRSYACD